MFFYKSLICFRRFSMSEIYRESSSPEDSALFTAAFLFSFEDVLVYENVFLGIPVFLYAFFNNYYFYSAFLCFSYLSSSFFILYYSSCILFFSLMSILAFYILCSLHLFYNLNYSLIYSFSCSLNPVVRKFLCY